MKVAVTGCSGFLGKRLIAKLLTIPDYEVVAFTSQTEELKKDFGQANVEVYQRDDFYGEQLANVDILINCAFPRNNEGTEMAKGLDYISRIFNVAKNKNIGAVINISSQSVYNTKRECAAVESEELCLETLYAVGKYSSELLTNNIFKDIKHTNLRMASLIGVGLEQRVVNKMIDRALQTNKLTVTKDKMHFGFMDVDDAVDAIISVVVGSDILWNEVYNIGIKGSYSLIDIADTIKDVLEERNISIYIDVENGENIFNSALICSRFDSTFNFVCKNSLADTVRKIVNFKNG